MDQDAGAGGTDKAGPRPKQMATDGAQVKPEETTGHNCIIDNAHDASPTITQDRRSDKLEQ